ncbi:hypothetical protein [Intestinibacter sp.]|uniref:hypothetical protein n=1 Tax=Intestinibacter sp. TaxID=1965304 RepID=UPI00307DEDB7
MNYDFMGVGQAIGGLAQTIGNGIISAKNLKHQKEVFNWQKEQQAWANQFAKDQFEYQKQQNDLTRQREDTAIQRRQQDLKQAGLNPLSAGDSGGASAQTMGGSTMAGGSQQGITPQMEQIAGLDNIFQGVMNIMTQKQNIAQSQTDQEYTREKTRTERDKQYNIREDTSKKSAETKELERKTQFYDTLTSEKEAQITAINKENELRELRKETERAKAADTWESSKNKAHDRHIAQSSATKTGERSYYGIADGSALIQGGGLVGTTVDYIINKLLGK